MGTDQNFIIENLKQEKVESMDYREYIEEPLRIDGRKIPYPVFEAYGYFSLHDKIDNIEEFTEKNPEIYEYITKILALKQSCFLLRHTTHSCGSLSDSLYQLKNELIYVLRKEYNYTFDEEWVESFVKNKL